jgi:hypothetical protein
MNRGCPVRRAISSKGEAAHLVLGVDTPDDSTAPPESTATGRSSSQARSNQCFTRSHCRVGDLTAEDLAEQAHGHRVEPRNGRGDTDQEAA